MTKTFPKDEKNLTNSHFKTLHSSVSFAP